ncbi:MAG: hypothetical protein ABIN89_23880 [Chitinophagaceae bacterium]
MEINKILGSDYLDIIFDGRNKDYGAYALRKTYNDRLAKALITMICFLLLGIIAYLFADTYHDDPLSKGFVAGEVSLIEVKPDEPKPELVIPPKPKPVKV